MLINRTEFENPENIPLTFLELDEIKNAELHYTYYNRDTNGRIDVLKIFHRPLANLPVTEKDIPRRDEIL